MNNLSKVFDELSSLLEQEGISSDAAEIQGIMAGMLGGGMATENREWLEALADFTNQGEPLPARVREELLKLYDETCQQLMGADFALSLCLPDDACPINDRGQALVKWVQGFMLGFGLHQADLTRCSEDVKEALEDFAEISRMDEEMTEDEASEQALFEVIEYVRVSAMLCFNELGRSKTQALKQSKTIH
ncbi:UPF0149 family protein [Bowmanella dokdonensis]|uniref:UPF0149 family protein n=1 Tax=Bowmanella dokdonensis TaxID=751969 RepID=A0A939DMN2_9ALTE|nr:UPF0149 family protein [Bowmanella dokdonensis]MBN7825588.1 UPF0149 family protein [Bowmanella dokdonensis]